MADQLLLPPAEDANGDRVSAAVAYFYQTGTTTPVTVYEEDGTTPLGTSVVAGSSGVFPQVFTTSGTAIKIDVKTPLGSSLPGYPVDPAIRVATTQGLAAQISFAPTVEIPETDVQAAIVNVQAQVAAEATAREQGRGFEVATTVPTSSGTGFQFTGIPAWATEIVVYLSDVSLSGTDSLLIRLGNAASGYLTSGYTSSSLGVDTTTPSIANTSAGFAIAGGNAADAAVGVVRMNKFGGTWMQTHSITRATTRVSHGAGSLPISDLDRVQITRTGSNTFDNGFVTVGWR